MTFTEAAAQVLRLVGKPLHYKEITDVAIEKDLLSHVGKSPEVTMGARLAALAKKGDKDNPLVRVKPGVFALREWDKQTVEKGLQDRTPALERIAQQGADRPEQEVEATTNGEPEKKQLASHEEVDDEANPPDDEERRRAEFAADARGIFEAEEDDDEPIFGAEPDDDEDRQDAGSRRRRRRRRRGRGEAEVSDSDDDLPSYTVSDVPEGIQLEEATVESRPERSSRSSRGKQRDRDGNRGDRDRDNRDRGDRDRDNRDRGDRDRDNRDRGDRDNRDRGDRDRDNRDRGDRDRGDRDRDNRDRDRGDRDRDRDLSQFDGGVGRQLADALESLLGGYDKNRGSVALQSLSDAVKRGSESQDIVPSAGLLAAVVRCDGLRRAKQGLRPRFRLNGNRIALESWSTDSELLQVEEQLLSLTLRHRDLSLKAFVKALQAMPHKAVGELVVVLLEELGFSGLSQVKRPGSHGAELHMRGTLTQGGGELRTAIVVRRDGREVGRERVTELRGALHHYGPAAQGYLITTGQVLSGAREEARAPGAAPVTLMDGARLAELCLERRVCVSECSLNLALPDFAQLEALRAS